MHSALSVERSWKADMEVVVIDRAAFNQGANAQYLPHIERTQVMDTLGCQRPARSLLLRR